MLIYPTPLSKPLDITIRDIRIRSLTFALDGDLEQAGQAFLRTLHIEGDSPAPHGGTDNDRVYD